MSKRYGCCKWAVEKTDDKMDKVIEALGQNAVILEKISIIDSSNKDR